MPLTTGQIVENRYRIVRLLGQGDSGAVYRAWDLRTRRPCTLKETRVIDYQTHMEFTRYASQLFKIRHPNLARLIDYFVIPGQGQYMVAEYIEGEELESVLGRTSGPLPDAQAVAWLEQIALALDYLHGQNPPIVHRGVNPADILIMSQEGGQAILVDYSPPSVIAPLTAQNAQSAKAAYLPPERGSGTMDMRGDIYAFGATAYHMLTGQRPVDSIQRKAGVELPLPSSLNSAIPEHVEEAILRAMEIAPEKRFQSVAEFAETILGRPLQRAARIPPSAPALAAQRPPAQPAGAQRAAAPPPAAVTQPSKGGRLIWWIVLTVFFCILASAAAFLLYRNITGEVFEAQIVDGQVSYQAPNQDGFELLQTGDAIPFAAGSLARVDVGRAALTLPGNYRLWMALDPSGAPSDVEFLRSGEPGKVSQTVLHLMNGGLVACGDDNADRMISLSVDTQAGMVTIGGGLVGVRYFNEGSRIMEIDCFAGLCIIEAGGLKVEIADNQRVNISSDQVISSPSIAAPEFYLNYSLNECIPNVIAPEPSATFTEALLPTLPPTETPTITAVVIATMTPTLEPSDTPTIASSDTPTLTQTPGGGGETATPAATTPNSLQLQVTLPGNSQTTEEPTATGSGNIFTEVPASITELNETVFPKKTEQPPAIQEEPAFPNLLDRNEQGISVNVLGWTNVPLLVVLISGLGILALVLLIVLGVAWMRKAGRRD